MSDRPTLCPDKPSVLLISASDSSGCAGLQADLHVLHELSVHAFSLVTGITAQTATQCQMGEAMDVLQMQQHWQAIEQVALPQAIKIGALVNAPQQLPWLQQQLLHSATAVPVIWDPVQASSSGVTFLAQDVLPLCYPLLACVDLVTPNLPELAWLSGLPVDTPAQQVIAARRLLSLGAKAVLVKGGHAQGQHCYDLLLSAKTEDWFCHPRLPGPAEQVRGTGCMLSTYIAGFIAQGKALRDAVTLACAQVQARIESAYALGGQRCGLVNTGVQRRHFPQVHSQPAPSNAPVFAPTEPLGLYAVVDSLEWIERLLPTGIDTLQLRIKQPPGAELLALIKRASQCCREAGVRLFINDHWALAIEAKAYGVHLGQEDLDHADLRGLAQAGLRLGISTHSEYEWARALTVNPSYIALGAVFTTQTKPARVIGLAQLKQWVHWLQSEVTLTAIGGIDLQRIDRVLATGVRSVAVVSAITGASKPQAAVAALQQRMRLHFKEDTADGLLADEKRTTDL